MTEPRSTTTVTARNLIDEPKQARPKVKAASAGGGAGALGGNALVWVLYAIFQWPPTLEGALALAALLSVIGAVGGAFLAGYNTTDTFFENLVAFAKKRT